MEKQAEKFSWYELSNRAFYVELAASVALATAIVLLV
jgi:hypothetical protein